MIVGLRCCGCYVTQCVAMCCIALRRVAVCHSMLVGLRCCGCYMTQYIAVCCCVLQCVAVCCNVLQCVAACCSVLQCVAVCCSVLQCDHSIEVLWLLYDAVCCSVLQCVATCCSVLQHDCWTKVLCLLYDACMCVMQHIHIFNMPYPSMCYDKLGLCQTLADFPGEVLWFLYIASICFVLYDTSICVT